MRVLVSHETSGIVREAFRRRGHDAWSLDILPSEDGSPYHLQRDVRHAFDTMAWDVLICHPSCTHLCVSGLHWNTRKPGRAKLTERALRDVEWLLAAPVKRICLENPVGIISTRIRPPDQYIQPYQFGEDASKKTGLWLKGLAPLRPTAFVEPRMVGGKPRWSNQTDSGQNRESASADRWRIRSRTYPGIATAMAAQWG